MTLRTSHAVLLSHLALFALSLGSIAWADLEVRVTTPETKPIILAVDDPCEFTAEVALDGEPLKSTELAWSWDFGDKSKTADTNPALHAYTSPGEYFVTITALYGKLTANAKVTVIVEEGQSKLLYAEGPGIIIFHPNEGGRTCDEAMVACAIPRAWFTANPGKSYAGARFFRIVDGQRVRADDAGANGWLNPDGGWFPWQGVEYKICPPDAPMAHRL